MFSILLALFIIVPIIEISLFIQVGDVLGMWPTIAIVFITAVVGAQLVRSQGIATLLNVQSRLEKGEIPAQQLLEGVLLAVAGVLLLTPGFLTDFLGMTVLLPAPRAWIAKKLMTKVQVQTMGGGFQSSTFGQDPFQDPFRGSNNDAGGQTFEGEYQKKEEDPNKQIKP